MFSQQIQTSNFLLLARESAAQLRFSRSCTSFPQHFSTISTACWTRTISRLTVQFAQLIDHNISWAETASPVIKYCSPVWCAVRGRGADCEDCLWRLNIPSLTSLAVINLYLGAGVWHTVAIGGLDRWCDKVCLLRYHTVIKRCAASHGHYNTPATPIILLLLFSTYRQGFNSI